MEEEQGGWRKIAKDGGGERERGDPYGKVKNGGG